MLLQPPRHHEHAKSKKKPMIMPLRRSRRRDKPLNMNPFVLCDVSVGQFSRTSCAVSHHAFCEDKLLRAAKARIDRMVKPHAKRRSLDVPEWMKEEWKKGDKGAIAKTLRDVNFDRVSGP